MKIFTFIGVAILALSVLLVGSYISAHNRANTAETGIEASYEDGKNVLGQYSLKIVEMVQITDRYKEDFENIVIEQMQGRYGENGSQAMFQWLQENNIALEPALYENVQLEITAGRNKFENEQRKLIDRKRNYERQLGSFWTGLWMNFAGYPKIDLADYEIIQSQHGIDTYETGIDSGLNLGR